MAEVVDVGGFLIVAAQHFVNLFPRLAGSPVVNQTEGVGHAQRRQEDTLLAADFAEHIETEVVDWCH